MMTCSQMNDDMCPSERSDGFFETELIQHTSGTGVVVYSLAALLRFHRRKAQIAAVVPNAAL